MYCFNTCKLFYYHWCANCKLKAKTSGYNTHEQCTLSSREKQTKSHRKMYIFHFPLQCIQHHQHHTTAAIICWLSYKTLRKWPPLKGGRPARRSKRSNATLTAGQRHAWFRTFSANLLVEKEKPWMRSHFTSSICFTCVSAGKSFVFVVVFFLFQYLQPFANCS